MWLSKIATREEQVNDGLQRNTRFKYNFKYIDLIQEIAAGIESNTVKMELKSVDLYHADKH